MTHTLNISVSKKPKKDSVISCRSLTLRERVLTKFFGQKNKVMVLIPGSTVSTVSITEIPEGGTAGG